jgi:hypothetical protein
MASILKVDEMQGVTSAGDITITSEGGSATQSLQQGLAKTWINFNGAGTIATRDSLNVSSLTDTTTGSYAVAFTNSFADTNYAGSAGLCGFSDAAGESNSPVVMLTRSQSNPFTTGDIDIITAQRLGTAISFADPEYVAISANGDLA